MSLTLRMIAPTRATLLRCWLSLLACAVLAVGCGDDAAKPSATTGKTDAVADVQLPDTAANSDAAVAEDGLATLDIGDAGPVLNCPGGPGCACTASSECDTGLCLDDPAGKNGKLCATLCASGCKPGYSCASVPGSGGDIINVCVSRFARLCDPCSKADDCETLGNSQVACVDRGSSGAYCGTLCSGDGDCPTGYTCGQVKNVQGGAIAACVPSFAAECTCSPRAVSLGLASTCWDPALGEVAPAHCKGQRACGVTGLGTCSAPAVSAESCNGIDDDCDGQTDEQTCDDGKTCTADSCSGADGCVHKPQDGGVCDADGSVCTGVDVCAAGSCQPGALLDCGDGNLCTNDACDKSAGCVHLPIDGTPCDADGSVCTPKDACSGGVCKAGGTLNCDDNNGCTTDACTDTEGCIHSGADGTPCDADGSECTVGDACFASACKPGTPLPCDDGNPCTADTCTTGQGCGHTPLDGGPCSDGDPCTTGDACIGVKCGVGLPKACPSPDPCLIPQCNPVNGVCGTIPVVDGKDCADGSKCTTADVCKGGACTGTAIVCDDSNPCTLDSCDPALGCTAVPNSAPCNDNNACTIADSCKSGACSGTPKIAAIDCSDGNPCTTESCDPVAGCQNLPNTLGCEDGNACTSKDICAGGTCTPGVPTTCSDGDPCTADVCDPVKGCEYPVVKDQTFCSADNANWCIAGVCQPKICKPGTTGMTCSECMYGFVKIQTKAGWVCAPDYPIWGARPLTNATLLADNGDNTVKDKQTGLQWQKGYSLSTVTWAQAEALCKSLTLAGKTDWRLPTMAELGSLIDFTKSSPALADLWAGTPNAMYWTAVPAKKMSGGFWYVNLYNGAQDYDAADSPYMVRCVRAISDQLPIANRFSVDAKGETVTDAALGRTWQRAVAPAEMNYATAKTYCAGLNLGGGGGWRLPDVDELRSIVVRSTFNPAMDPLFTGADGALAIFWSGTPLQASNNALYWGLQFASGALSSYDVTGTQKVRCIK